MGCPLGRMTPVDVQGGAYLLVDLASARRDDQPRRARLDGVVERCRAAVEHVNVLSRLRLVRTKAGNTAGVCACGHHWSEPSIATPISAVLGSSIRWTAGKITSNSATLFSSGCCQGALGP